MLLFVMVKITYYGENFLAWGRWSAHTSVDKIVKRSRPCRRRKDELETKRLAEMEEAALQIEEKYGGLADEAEQKTKKLKKLWKKFQEVNGSGGAGRGLVVC